MAYHALNASPNKSDYTYIYSFVYLFTDVARNNLEGLTCRWLLHYKLNYLILFSLYLMSGISLTSSGNLKAFLIPAVSALSASMNSIYRERRSIND